MRYSFFNSIANYFDDYSIKIILVLTEERKNKNIYVLVGGENSYKDKESFENAAIRKVYEELGIKLNPAKLLLFDDQIGYPDDGPYKKEGITSAIITFVYYITEEELANIVINTVSIEGCDIVKIVVMPVPDVLEAIEKDEINVYTAAKATLQKLEKYLQEGN